MGMLLPRNEDEEEEEEEGADVTRGVRRQG
jgi:hypothetical protein